MKCATIGCKAPATYQMTYRYGRSMANELDEVCTECLESYQCRVIITVLHVVIIADERADALRGPWVMA